MNFDYQYSLLNGLGGRRPRPLSRFPSREIHGCLGRIGSIMKSTYIKTALTIGLFAGLVVQGLAATPEVESRFVADAKSAFDAKDSSKLLRLVCWDGVTPEMKTMLTQQFSGMVQQSTSQLELVAPDPNKKIEFTRNGVSFHLNLAVIKQLKITLVTKPGDSASVTIPVGEKDGNLFIATTAPVK